MKTFNRFLMAALCTSAMTAPAFAQDQDEAQQADTYDENVIIVTATRRAQDVQAIPLAVTAVSPVPVSRFPNLSMSNASKCCAVHRAPCSVAIPLPVR